MEGMPVNFTDAASVLTVPAGGTAATTYHACLKYDVSSNTVSAVLVADADLDGSYLKLYSILIPNSRCICNCWIKRSRKNRI
jgi:hypothetical protein